MINHEPWRVSTKNGLDSHVDKLNVEDFDEKLNSEELKDLADRDQT